HFHDCSYIINHEADCTSFDPKGAAFSERRLRKARGRGGTDGTDATYGTRAIDGRPSFQGSFFLMDGEAIRSSPESVQLHEVVPWGRSLDEYRAMFALSEGDLQGRLLGRLNVTRIVTFGHWNYRTKMKVISLEKSF